MPEEEAIAHFKRAKDELLAATEAVDAARKRQASAKAAFREARATLCIVLGVGARGPIKVKQAVQRNRAGTVLEAVKKIGPCSRLDLEQECQMSQSMVGYYLRKLSDKKLVVINAEGFYEAPDKSKGVTVLAPELKTNGGALRPLVKRTANLTERDKVLKALERGPASCERLALLTMIATKPLQDVLKRMHEDGEVVQERGLMRLPL